MSDMGSYKNIAISISIIIIAALNVEMSCAQEYPYENFRNEVAKMASQIPPDKRKSVAVTDLRMDREELQGCIGRLLTEAMIEVLREFQFTFIEKTPLFREASNRKTAHDNLSSPESLKNIGAKSMFTGTVNTAGELIQIKCRMTNIETMGIIGYFSCNLSKMEFKPCFLKDNLTPPVRHLYRLYPEPKRVH